MRCGEQAEGQGRRSLNLDAAIEPREPDQLPWVQERSGRAGRSLSPGPAVPTDSAQPRGLRSRGRGGRPSRGLAAPWPGLALLPLSPDSGSPGLLLGLLPGLLLESSPPAPLATHHFQVSLPQGLQLKRPPFGGDKPCWGTQLSLPFSSLPSAASLSLRSILYAACFLTSFSSRDRQHCLCVPRASWCLAHMPPWATRDE